MTSNLANKNVVLGVTGGVAAYKAAEITRELTKLRANVQVVMTDAAKEFITPLSFQSLSGRPTRDTLFDPIAESGMSHIELGKWADIIIVAPASANFMAQLTAGMAPDLLTTLCLVTNAVIYIAPSMNQAMWHNSATQSNLHKLIERDIKILGPGSGEQACGDFGLGRMLEPKAIIKEITEKDKPLPLAGLNITITAGPTWESIDPVRGLTNSSSGKMGYSVAKAAKYYGGIVNLISGPTTLQEPEGVEFYKVESALDMLEAVRTQMNSCDIFISVAAVSDYSPVVSMDHKIKKYHETMTLELKRNPDILMEVSKIPNPPFTVGFAAETHDPISNAKKKIKDKNLDLIAVNHINESNNPFGGDYNHLILVSRSDEFDLGLQHKEKLGRDLIKQITQRYYEKNPT